MLHREVGEGVSIPKSMRKLHTAPAVSKQRGFIPSPRPAELKPIIQDYHPPTDLLCDVRYNGDLFENSGLLK